MKTPHASSKEWVVEPVDLQREQHQAGLLELINDYSLTEFGNGRPLHPAILERLVEGLVSCEGYRGFLAIQGTQPVGLANCFVGYSTFRAQPLLNVHDLCVHHQWRGQGIGRKLLESVSQWAEELGFCRITLEVRSDNEVAKGLYHSMGFRSGLPQGLKMEFLTKQLNEASP